MFSHKFNFFPTNFICFPPKFICFRTNYIVFLQITLFSHKLHCFPSNYSTFPYSSNKTRDKFWNWAFLPKFICGKWVSRGERRRKIPSSHFSHTFIFFLCVFSSLTVSFAFSDFFLFLPLNIEKEFNNNLTTKRMIFSFLSSDHISRSKSHISLFFSRFDFNSMKFIMS